VATMAKNPAYAEWLKANGFPDTPKAVDEYLIWRAAQPSGADVSPEAYGRWLSEGNRPD
jgi:hypothetical protein